MQAAELQRLRRSGTGTVMLISTIGAAASAIGLIATLVLGFRSMAGTGIGFEVGYSNTGGPETYVRDKQGIDALMATAEWGLSFSAALLVFTGIATVALIVHLVRQARF